MDSIGGNPGKYGGSIWQSGSAFGSLAEAKENEYFKKIDEKLLEEMKHDQQQKNVEEKSKEKNKKV
jgi:hypothetical protein